MPRDFKKLKVNGEVIPEGGYGKKLKLYEVMSPREVTLLIKSKYDEAKAKVDEERAKKAEEAKASA